MIVLTAASGHSGSIDPTVLLTWATCLSILAGGILAMLKYGRKIMLMVEDFNGTPERPGVPARPGILLRIQSLDEQVAVIHGEVNYNHGGSIKDAVDRIDARLENMDDYVKTKDIEKMSRLDDIDHTITDLHGKYLERMAGVDADLKSLHEADN